MEQGIKTYFITDGEFVKIGFSNSPIQRLKILQTGYPKPLKIIKVVPGNHEKEYHALFDEYRQMGEWFKIDGKLEQFLSFVLQGDPKRLNDKYWSNQVIMHGYSSHTTVYKELDDQNQQIVHALKEWDNLKGGIG